MPGTQIPREPKSPGNPKARDPNEPGGTKNPVFALAKTFGRNGAQKADRPVSNVLRGTEEL